MQVEAAGQIKDGFALKGEVTADILRVIMSDLAPQRVTDASYLIEWRKIDPQSRVIPTEDCRAANDAGVADPQRPQHLSSIGTTHAE